MPVQISISTSKIDKRKFARRKDVSNSGFEGTSTAAHSQSDDVGAGGHGRHVKFLW